MQKYIERGAVLVPFSAAVVNLKVLKVNLKVNLKVMYRKEG